MLNQEASPSTATNTASAPLTRHALRPKPISSLQQRLGSKFNLDLPAFSPSLSLSAPVLSPTTNLSATPATRAAAASQNVQELLTLRQRSSGLDKKQQSADGEKTAV